MFFLRYLEREISLHPSFLGNNINDFLQRKLYEDMEGSCNGEYYIICIMDIYNISAGKVRPGTGIAEFTILYRAILWKPFKGEAVGCIRVTQAKRRWLTECLDRLRCPGRQATGCLLRSWPTECLREQDRKRRETCPRVTY